MEPDGIQYLDVASKYLAKDWTNAVNAYWSPLYSWLLAVMLWAVKPSMSWEFFALKAVNFFLFLLGLLGLEFFLYQLERYRQKQISLNSPGQAFIPEIAIRSLAYALFISMTIRLIDLTTPTPDIGVLVMTIFLAGLTFNFLLGEDPPLFYFFFGTILGIGYLMKLILLPFAVCLTAAIFIFAKSKKPKLGSLLIVLGFLCVSLPFVAAIYKTKGRLTFGYSAAHNYGNFNGRTGKPKYFRLTIFPHSEVFHFDKPEGVTFPYSYDVSYWDDGYHLVYNLSNQINSIKKSFPKLCDALADYQNLFILFACLFFCCKEKRFFLSGIKDHAILILSLISILGAYLLINICPRYLPPFVIPLIVLIFAGLKISSARSQTRIAGFLVFLFSLQMLFPFFSSSMIDLSPDNVSRKLSNNRDFKTAEDLQKLGLKAGDKITSIELCYDYYWARLLRLQYPLAVSIKNPKVLSDIQPPDELLDHLAQNKIKAIVAKEVLPITSPGWHRIHRYYAYLIPEKKTIF